MVERVTTNGFQPDYGLYNDMFLKLGGLSIYSLADLGCGDGPFVKVMTDRKQPAHFYWGVDADLDKVEKARNNFPGWNFVYGDVFSDRIKNELGRFDAFLMVDFLEHLEGDRDLKLLASLPIGSYTVFTARTVEAPDGLRWFEKAEDINTRYSHLIQLQARGKYTSKNGIRWHSIIGQRH